MRSVRLAPMLLVLLYTSLAHAYIPPYNRVSNYQFQLVKYADAPDLSESFVDWSYDAYGRKVAETVYDNANAVTSQTLYVWDGWRLLEEVNGLEGHAGQVIADYVPGPGYVDDLVAMRRDQNRDGDFADAGEGFLYFLTDQQYSTVALLDGTGAVVERYGYDAFGAPSFYDSSGTPIAASAVGNNHLYTDRGNSGDKFRKHHTQFRFIFG